MTEQDKILIENELYRLVTTLYDSFGEEAQEEIKKAIHDFSEEHQITETEVLEVLNQKMKDRKNYPSKDLKKWYPDKD